MTDVETNERDEQIFQAGYKAGVMYFSMVIQQMLGLDEPYPFDEVDSATGKQEYEKWVTTSSQADSPIIK